MITQFILARSALRWARHHPLLALAAASAATAVWARRQGRQAEQRQPPIGRFIDTDGTRLHYIDQGSGPVVVLLHGNLVLLQDFIGSGLIERLARTHRVIAFDRPGYGYSTRPRGRAWGAAAQAELVHHALRSMGVDEAVVLGHSWGALAALALAQAQPRFVRGLVLVSGYYYPTPRPDVALTAPAAWPVVGDVIRHTSWPLLGRVMLKPMVRAMFSPRPVPDDFFDPQSRGMMLRPWQMRAAAEDASMMLPAAQAMSRRYAQLTTPMHILAGEGDKVVDPQGHAVKLHHAVPHSRLHVLPGVGHMVHYAAPDAIVSAIAQLTAGDTAGPTLAGLDEATGDTPVLPESNSKGIPHGQQPDRHRTLP